MRPRTLLRSGAAALALWAGGCGDDDDSGESGESGGELTVSAAASLTDALPEYGETIDGEERFSFAGSDELAAQIRQGATPDVFASASTTYPDELYDEGLVEEPAVFTRNQLVIAVPADSDLESIDELTEPDLDVVIGAKGVPVGDYAREVLGGLPHTDSAAILDNVRSEESDVKGIVGKLTQGAADAGFVYESDVAADGDALRAIELPSDLEPEVSYGIAVVSDAANPDGAEAFIDGLLAPDGQRILEDNGFLPAQPG
jgi:molybdate transport system substrate-binding protein